MMFVFTRLSKTATVPQRMTQNASGFDLFADIEEPIILQPGDIFAVPTGIAMHIPEGFEGQVRPRSGLALKHGITVLNSPGTIDADYRGEIKVILINMGRSPFILEPKMRIAQMVFCPVATPMLVEAEELDASDRQAGGFGHTGN